MDALICALKNQNGYSAADYQGTKGLTSNKGNIKGTIWNNDHNYLSVAAVDFDHGNGLVNIPISGVPSDEFHYLFEDQFGTLSGGWPGSGNGPYSTAQKAVYDFVN